VDAFGAYPHYSTQNSQWSPLLNSYLNQPEVFLAGYGRSAGFGGVFYCPNDTKRQAGAQRVDGGMWAFPDSYGYNLWGLYSAESGDSDLGLAGRGHRLQSDGGFNFSTREAEVLAPSDMLALGDSYAGFEANKKLSAGLGEILR